MYDFLSDVLKFNFASIFLAVSALVEKTRETTHRLYDTAEYQISMTIIFSFYRRTNEENVAKASYATFYKFLPLELQRQAMTLK